MSNDKGRTNDSAAKVLEVLKALRGHSLIGLSNGQLAKALGESPSNINRCLNTLIAAGLAEKKPSGLFSHSVMMVQIATAHANEMSRARAKLDELDQRVIAGSYN
ncbi:helix-turn-helix domain-containing protein [Cellvibrio sp. PSBB023]|uniref:helix-turn-helix domain-containing protein n=1 Tax=Cellvibrio sp. PSBB023 TaxID=1945512 RepID=UPI0009901397|nr:helix-turn-helix domain-containing protein [Cellvibrio sp. PSBB023]AQT58698.1 IclR family transcriptional regulator [Cellvibrio sp. PSBB023]